MSRIHYRSISLEQLVQCSELVLIVKTADPPQRKIPVPIGASAPSDPAQKRREVPAFLRVQSRCEVQGALTAAGAKLVGKTLEIDGSHWRQSLAMHKSYYLQGIRRSPIYERYQPADAPAEPDPADAPFIVFLRREGGSGFAFVADGAVERMESRSAIEEYLRQRE